VIENPVKRVLEQGGFAFGAMLFEFATAGIARVLAAAGAEFVIFDQEHTGWSVETLKPLLAGSRANGIVPLVRVPATEQHLIAAALDAGAMGLMVPMVEDAGQARRIVTAAKYPPHGRRGFGLLYRDELGEDPVAVMDTVNREQVLIALVETAAGVDHVEQIAAVEGIDLLWIGHRDLTNSLGIPSNFADRRYRDAVERILEAGRATGKAVGMTAATPAEGRELLARGFRCVCYGDLWLYEGALREALDHLRTAVPVAGTI
jgi:2-keto-3-deoxy-L-rhamnonate aldolase RhmA